MRCIMALLFAILFSLSTSSSLAAIQGADDRTHLTPSSPLRALGQATAVGVLNSMIEENSYGRFTLDAKPLDKFVCKDEKFSADPTNAYACSGFLVGPDLLVTAGHCASNTGEVRNEEKMHCEAYGWLFDFQSDDFGRTQLAGITADRFYRCKKIIFAVVDEAAPFRDFALIQLDRPVTGRKPLNLAAEEPRLGDALHMIGYPFGTPMKLSRNAEVKTNVRSNQILLASLDTFEGNSGSAVFNAENEVVGILVGGTPTQSFFQKQGESCYRYNRCDEKGETCAVPDKDVSVFPGYQGPGAEVQKILPIKELLRGLL